MTDPTTPMPPDQPSWPPPPPTAPAGAAVPTPATTLPDGSTLAAAPVLAAPGKRSNVRAWAVGGIALILALCCGGAVIGAVSGDDPKPAADATSSSTVRPSNAAPTTATRTTAPATTAPAVATYDTPTKSNFKLAVKILRKQCFGSAGCNITYRIDVTYAGVELDPSATYEVTYEVKGGEDPIVNTFEVTGDSASVQQEEMASTKRSADKLTAVVTSVSNL